jgi:hypothetical protein
MPTQPASQQPAPTIYMDVTAGTAEPLAPHEAFQRLLVATASSNTPQNLGVQQ